MKVHIEMGTKFVEGDESCRSELKPYVISNVEFTDEERLALKQNSGDLFGAITRLINFAIQHMQ